MDSAIRPPSTPANLVLVVAGNQRALQSLRTLLLKAELDSITVADLEAATAAAAKTTFGVAVIDFATLGTTFGFEVFSAVRRASSVTEIVVLLDQNQPSFDLAVLAVRKGACDVILKTPDDLAYLGPRVSELHRHALANAERAQLLAETARLNEELLYKLTDTARRVGELRSLMSHRGGSPLPPEQELCSVLLVEDDGWLKAALAGLLPKAFTLSSAVSGGEALDSASIKTYDLALIKDSLPDLPGRMVVRTLSAQAPETMVLLFVPPSGKRPGRIERVEGGRLVPLVAEWHEPKQLAERLGELHQAQLARRRERRYLAEFRAENHDLLRRFADLRKRLREGSLEPLTSGTGRGSSKD